MFKKFMFSLFLLVVSFTLVACGDKNKPRTYVADGVYTAFEESVSSRNMPEVTMVSVTIKDDKVTAFNIDTIQGTSTKKDDVVNGRTFNAKSKKELGYEYYMHTAANAKVDGVLDVEAYKAWLTANNKKEWFEQANLLEAAMVANGVDSVVVKEDNKTDSVSGVTVTVDTYVRIAKAAVENAKAGKLVAVATMADDVIWATANVDKDGKVTGYKIDVLQGQFADNTFSFRDKSKQELGYAYFMHKGAFGQAYDETAYKAWLTENNKKEWFEQVAILAAKFEAEGTGSLVPDTAGKFTVTGVSISDNKYVAVLEKILANSKVK